MLGRHPIRAIKRAATVAGLSAFALFPVAATAADRDAPSHRGAPAPRHKFGRGTSTNWSGYAVTGTGANHVIGSWTQPRASCSAGEDSWSSPWVGIDGYSSNTVEQIGTDTDCFNGSPDYYAWYEMYPKRLVTIAIPVRPGDSFTGEVTYSSGNFVLKLTNRTTGSVFKTTQAGKKVKRSSAEWVMEGPSSGRLTNFGSVGFTGASATIGGRTGTLGSLLNRQPITMVNSSGAARAVPTAIGSDGSSFAVNWLRG